MSGGRGVRAREVAASAAQYALLGGFAAVAAGISAQGLTGFAHANMGLRGPWPYLLFFALDGAAGVCAVLLMRIAERRPHSALTRAGFADPGIAAQVLRQVQVLALTPRLAILNYDTAEAARTVVAGLIAPGPAAVPPDVGSAKHDTPADSAHRGA